MKPLISTHVTLSRVLVLSLTPSVALGAVVIWNTISIQNDRAARKTQIDAEICSVIARLPGNLNAFERAVHCPITPPIALPTPTVRPTQTVTVRPSVKTSPGAFRATTSSPALVSGADAPDLPALRAPLTPSPQPTATPTVAPPQVAPTPAPAHVLCILTVCL